ncbi:MAG TPA: hypothetical protein VMX97_05185 [Hyphomicrobiaceae bacterium]|nr:hypothetical protein [Hyphomicrobiaceae bacterium]
MRTFLAALGVVLVLGGFFVLGMFLKGGSLPRLAGLSITACLGLLASQPSGLGSLCPVACPLRGGRTYISVGE